MHNPVLRGPSLRSGPCRSGRRYRHYGGTPFFAGPRSADDQPTGLGGCNGRQFLPPLDFAVDRRLQHTEIFNGKFVYAIEDFHDFFEFVCKDTLVG